MAWRKEKIKKIRFLTKEVARRIESNFEINDIKCFIWKDTHKLFLSFFVMFLLNDFDYVVTIENPLVITYHSHIWQDDFANTLRKLNSILTAWHFNFLFHYLPSFFPMTEFSFKNRNVPYIKTFPDPQNKMFRVKILFFMEWTAILHSAHQLLFLVFA